MLSNSWINGSENYLSITYVHATVNVILFFPLRKYPAALFSGINSFKLFLCCSHNYRCMNISELNYLAIRSRCLNKCMHVRGAVQSMRNRPTEGSLYGESTNKMQKVNRDIKTRGIGWRRPHSGQHCVRDLHESEKKRCQVWNVVCPP